MAKIALKYGNGIQKIHVPSSNIMYVAKAHSIDVLSNFDVKICKALDNPISSDRLEDMVSSDSKVALIIDDITRPTPTSKILQIILERLRRKNIRERNISIIMATGAHQRPSLEQIKGKVGESLLSVLELFIHDCLSKKELELIDFSSRGTPVWINKKVLDADIKIGIGLIKPHTWAGFGGGAKIVLPGVSSWEAIGRNHFLAISDNARIGNVEENPVRNDMEEVAQKVGLDMIVNVVLNDDGQPVDIVAGDVIKAHRKGIRTARRLFEKSIEEEVDIAIWAFGPKDHSLWDVLTGNFIGAHKKLLKKGGTIILVAECPDGLYKYGHGHLDFTGKIADYSRVIEMLKSKMDPQELLSETIRGNMPYLEVGVKAYILSKLAIENDVIIVSENIKKEDVNWLGSTMDNVQDALSYALKAQSGDATIAIFPEFSTSAAYIRKV